MTITCKNPRIPGYVTLSYGVGLLGLPLAVFVPPPAAVARRASTITMLLLTLGITLLIVAIVVQLLGHWYEGIAIGAGALATLFGMFWAAAPRRRDASDEDEEGGGGGGGSCPRGPGDEPAPGGTCLDWGEFDRLRDHWAADAPVAPRERELSPA